MVSSGELGEVAVGCVEVVVLASFADQKDRFTLNFVHYKSNSPATICARVTLKKPVFWGEVIVSSLKKG